MKISTLSKKTYKAQIQSDSYCAQIVIQAASKYRKTQDEWDEDKFIENLGCFIQAGDGLVFTDVYGSNVPVSAIDKIIEEKGYFTYKDFESNKI